MSKRKLIKKNPVIYRIQDADGRGPWKPGFSHHWVESRPDHDNLSPSYVEFPGLLEEVRKIGLPAGSGCIELKQLKRWFVESEYRTLLMFGYRCVQMQVKKILRSSDIQCFFIRQKPLNLDCKIVELYQ